MPAKREDLAYAAGLIEGEGHIGLNGSSYTRKSGDRVARKTFYPRLVIGMSDREPLERLVKIFPFTRITGPYKTKFNGKPCKDTWRWLCPATIAHTQAIVVALWEWLSPRRQEQYLKMMRKVLTRASA